jgi:hypothetical protein
MAKKFIDLSIAIEDGLPSDPPLMIPKIQYVDHKQGAETMIPFFPGIDPEKDLPNGLGWAVELLSVSTHAGTISTRRGTTTPRRTRASPR